MKRTQNLARNRYTHGPYHSRQPSPAKYPQTHRYTLDEIRDVVELIDQGWCPLDVAVAYGMPVFLVNGGPRLYSSVYRNYDVWSEKLAALDWFAKLSATRADH